MVDVTASSMGSNWADGASTMSSHPASAAVVEQAGSTTAARHVVRNA